MDHSAWLFVAEAAWISFFWCAALLIVVCAMNLRR